MIKNIVFDLGNVLIDFNPKRIISAVFMEKADQDLILKEVFKSEGWDQLDRGVIRFEDHFNKLAKKWPQYTKEIGWILDNWHKDQPHVRGMYSLVESISHLDFNLFVLSNASHRFYDYATTYNPIFKFFKGVTISADLKLLKPEKEIYDRFCQIHNLRAEECLFIDDQYQNVQGAINAGWQAYQFKDAEDLRHFFNRNSGIELGKNK